MAIKNVNDFVNSAEYAASLKEGVAHKAWYYATKLVEEKFTSTNSAMDAIRKAYIEGYGMGHHHTVESCYCPEQAAEDWLSEQHQ